jgi:hypothetical protein
VGISSFQLDNGLFTHRVCGESTQPKRGEMVGEDRCECGRIGDNIAFFGEACECASVNGLICGGEGVCKKAKFDLGFCSSDIQRLNNDPLRTPYLKQSTFTDVVGHGQILVNGTLWVLPQGTLISVEYLMSRELNVSYFPCNIYYKKELNTGGPNSGYYKNIILSFQGQSLYSAQFTDPFEDCSNPIARILSDAQHFYSGFGACDHLPITSHSNTLGLGYGLFWNATVDFSLEAWTMNHYQMIANIFGNRKCSSFNERKWDEFLFSLNVSAPFNTSTLLQNHKVLAVTIFQPLKSTAVVKDQQGQLCAVSTLVGKVTLNTSLCSSYLGVFDSNGSMLQPDSFLLREETIEFIFSTFANLTVYPCEEEPFLNMSNVQDLQFIRDMYNVHFAPRRCGNRDQCQQFEESTCVMKGFQPWFGGPATHNGFGEEGGCDCNQGGGFFSPESFCSSCKLGYGPDTVEDFQNMQLFKVKNWTHLSTKRCTLPIDASSSRVTSVCGGRGFVRVVSPIVTHLTVSVMQGEVAKCLYLDIQGVVFKQSDVSGPLQTFISSHGNIANVVDNHLYVKGNLTDFVCIQTLQRNSTLRLLKFINGNQVKKENEFSYFI